MLFSFKKQVSKSNRNIYFWVMTHKLCSGLRHRSCVVSLKGAEGCSCNSLRNASHWQLQGENSAADGAAVRCLCGARGSSASALLAVAQMFLPLRAGIVTNHYLKV